MLLRLRPVAALLVVTLVVACLRVGAAHAQATAAPPDIVRLRNGGMLRGTIVELVPGDQVTLLGADGQTRKLPMSDVAYAGPVAGDPLAPPPAPTPIPIAPAATPYPPPPAPESRRLRLLADEPHLTYHYLAGTSQGVGLGAVGGHIAAVGINMAHYTRLCTAPCTTSLEAGSYTFAIEREGGPTVLAPAMTIRGDEELKAHWVSRSGLRWGLFLTGVAATTIGILVGMKTTQSCSPYYMGPDPQGNQITLTSCTDDYPNLVPGTILFTLGLTTMLVPLFIRDSVEIAPTGR
jgi:hypothetical protein